MSLLSIVTRANKEANAPPILQQADKVTDAAIIAEFTAEVTLVLPHVTTALNALLADDNSTLTCWWNGQVALLDDPLAEGMIRRSGCIDLASSNYGSPARWRRYIHELIHGHSNVRDANTTGYEGYAANPGWEEAPVEYLQRYTRAQVLTPLGINPDAPEILEVERNWRYNTYLEEMAKVCALDGVLEKDAARWYAEMLRVPVAERYPRLMLKMKRRDGILKVKELVAFGANLKRKIL